MNDKEKHLIDNSTQTGVSNWLMVLTITKFGFKLYKRQFWHSTTIVFCQWSELSNNKEALADCNLVFLLGSKVHNNKQAIFDCSLVFV